MHKLDGIFVQISRDQYDAIIAKEADHQGGFNTQNCDGSVKFVSLEGNSHDWN